MTRDTSSGKILEGVVISTLEKRGFVFVPYADWKNPKRKSQLEGKDVVIRNYPYRTIYNRPGRTEFLLLSPSRGLEIRIECKWQQSEGSVDEKFPYLYLNAIETMEEEMIIVLYGGEGFKEGSVEWLKNAVSEKKYQSPSNSKNILVMKTEEFMAWANKTFRK